MSRIQLPPDHGEPVEVDVQPRKALTTLQKLKVMVRYSVCPLCGDKLGKLEDVDFDHIHERSDGGDNSLENHRPVHKWCHKAKTKLAQKDRAKSRRIRGENKEKPKRKIASRPFGRGRKRQ